MWKQLVFIFFPKGKKKWKQPKVANKGISWIHLVHLLASQQKGYMFIKKERYLQHMVK
jgi:hypothetical protein